MYATYHNNHYTILIVMHLAIQHKLICTIKNIKLKAMRGQLTDEIAVCGGIEVYSNENGWVLIISGRGPHPTMFLDWPLLLAL